MTLGGRVRCLLVTGVIAVCAAAPRAAAQDATPTVPHRVEALVGAFEQVSARSDAASWQAADAAFNDAVALLDALRAGLVADVGEPALAASSGVDSLLPELVAALDAEDSAAVRAVVALIRSQLRPLAPSGVAPGASPLATRLLLDWRSDLAAALASGLAGRWNDMRDAAGDLSGRMERSGPTVLSATGAAGTPEIQRAVVFTMRVRAAALDRSIGDASAAAAIAEEALAALLRGASGPTAAAIATTNSPSGIQFRALAGEASPGSVAVVAILADGIPDVGLGAFTLRVRWSSQALTLRDVAWDVGQGSIDRGGGAGTVVLEWPPAPTGPRGSTSVARLTFDVLGESVNPRDYLPATELDALETALAGASERFMSADVAEAGALVMAAYLDFAAGKKVDGSLWEALAGRGLGAPLEGGLLNLLEALSRPAEPDVILERLELVSALLSATVDSYAAPLYMPGQVPVVIEALAAFDTRGQAVPLRDAPPASVLVTGSGLPPASAGSPTPIVAAAPTALETAGATTSAGAVPPVGAVLPGSTASSSPVPVGVQPRPNSDPAASPLPLPLVGTLLAAAAAGAAAVLWGRKRQDSDSLAESQEGIDRPEGG